jgi:hypothetical protein
VRCACQCTQCLLQLVKVRHKRPCRDLYAQPPTVLHKTPATSHTYSATAKHTTHDLLPHHVRLDSTSCKRAAAAHSLVKPANKALDIEQLTSEVTTHA